MPDRPTARAEREPLPFSPSAAGCAFSVHVHAGQWGMCGGRPAVTCVWTSPRDRERWRAFACAAHADRFDGPEWRDVGPLDDTARPSWTTGAPAGPPRWPGEGGVLRSRCGDGAAPTAGGARAARWSA